MKIFITGSSGFIGTELIKHLEGKHEIKPYSHEDGNDILNYEHLKSAMKGSDIVIHLAAIKKPLEDKTFADYFNINCKGTFNVAQAAMENKIKRLIFTSSTSYYGIEKGLTVKTPILESSPILTQHTNAEDLTDETRPCDIAYSTSKVITEQILANYGMSKMIEVVILRIGPTRPTGVYKPFGEDLKLHLKIENCLQAIELSINSEKKLWYEAFSIMDKIDSVDITKAEQILGYKPI